MNSETIHIVPQIKYISQQFDAEKIHQYQLFAEISDNYFHFWVVEHTSKSLLALESFVLPVQLSFSSPTDNLSQIFSQHDFLKSLKWKSVKITIDNHSFTLLPVALFRKEYTNKYLQLAKGQFIGDDEEVRQRLHPSLEMLNIYSCERKLYNWLAETYPLVDLEYEHLSSELIEFALRSSKSQSAFIYVGSGAFTLVITLNGTLKFCNRFVYATPEDLAYYVLFVMSELGIEPDEIFLRLYGNIEKDAEEYKVLTQYLPKVKIGDTSTDMLFDNKIALHHYLGLSI
ncbi:DUF3822 family protein [Arcicella rigui]|uniref:DUF3822 family protein n=1 Tax=Arcicella rigui TaxID=797020 RepID=A0ABU5Q8P6_9BACT|nr:DUF3822 family protein [Arcicella rigui]MEA5139218.1 DUF3822 family protein [Arcicella rigui]